MCGEEVELAEVMHHRSFSTMSENGALHPSM